MHGSLLCALAAAILGLGAAALSPVRIIDRPSFQSTAPFAVCVVLRGDDSRLGQCQRASGRLSGRQRTATAAEPTR